MTVWSAFAAVAERFPDRIAVETQRADSLERWTYRDLHVTARAEGLRLREAGVQPGDRCAILGDYDARWCAAYLAILQVGAIAVPLDSNGSAAQVAAIIADADPRLLLTSERLESVAREALRTHTAVRLERLGARAATAPLVDGRAGDPSSPAVILYTSGTTADPKGVVLSHANLLAARDAVFSVVPVRDADSVLGVLPLCHAFGQLANLLLPFAAGARVVFVDTLNSTELVRALAERRITLFACVPQFLYVIHQRIFSDVARRGLLARFAFRALLATSGRLRRAGINIGPVVFGRVHELLGKQMRLLVTGGSKFDPAIGRDLYALGFTIVQAYGLTETSGAATLTTPDEAHLDTVGRVLPGQELRIVPSEDPALDGEIAIRGPIVMQGYYGRPDATAAVLLGDWLLTGDLGRVDDRGRVTITGRKQEVIVLASGKNIHPDEIEAQYRQSAYVKEICVMGLTAEHDPTSERLYAVVVPNMDLMRDRRIANAGDLLRFELDSQSVHLPPHKRVLGYEVCFEPLPRTTAGELKRHEVEHYVRQTARAAAEVRAHDWGDDPHASFAAEIIARRARRRSVTPAANLELDLGLDSMDRVELIAELEQSFGVRVPDERAHDILTVSQLIDAVRAGATITRPAVAAEESWAAILRDAARETDPALGRLLRRRRVAPALLFLALRLLRRLVPVIVSGHEHLPARGPYIICPNHQSFLDPLFVCSALPYRAFKELFFVGASEYFDTPLTAWAARQCNLVPVNPDAQLVPAMKAAAYGLTRGKVLVMFPEGERSIDGTVKRFKKGAPILSRHLGVPVVPVAIHGVFELWPRNRRFNWRLLIPGTRHRIQVAFGAPMTFDHRATSSDAADALRARVSQLWEALHD